MLPLPLLVFLVWSAFYFARHPEPHLRARFLRNFAFVVMMVTGGLFTLFVAGETLSDPGGLAGIALVASWVLPLTALAVTGWRWPEHARIAFEVLTGAVLAMTVASVFNRAGWNSFEDSHGPVRTIVSFALLFALSFFAWKRPWVGGLLMLAISVIPLLLSVGAKGFAAMVLLNSTSTLSAVLFLWSASLGDARHDNRPSRATPANTQRRTDRARRSHRV